VLDGLDGNDSLKGFGGYDTLHVGDDHDTLSGMDGSDTLYGEDGDDNLIGGPGPDAMIGGYGNDAYLVDLFSDTVTELANQGIDTVRTSTTWILAPGVHVEVLRTTDDAGVTNINLTGNSHDNELIGNDGVNVLNGAEGADDMTGHGSGDIYYVDHANDAVGESGGDGIDQVYTSVSWTLTNGADVEQLRTINEASGSPINLTGNSSGNLIRGNSGPNIIAGGGGKDTLVGLSGQDIFLFDTALDPMFNVDVLFDFNFTEDFIHLENAIFGSLAPGPLAADRFVIGAAAQDGNDNIIYNSATGALLYDSDGSGATAAIQFATVNGLGPTHVDFVVV
jgi:Ca2+-binding RTX toxin-like protein